MLREHSALSLRAERFVPRRDSSVLIKLSGNRCGLLQNISSSGLGAIFAGTVADWSAEARVQDLDVMADGQTLPCGEADVVRTEAVEGAPAPSVYVGFRFTNSQTALVDELGSVTRSQHRVNDEVKHRSLVPVRSVDAYKSSLDRFYSRPGASDVFSKCDTFRGWIDNMIEKDIYQRLYRVTVTGPLDHRISVYDPGLRGERELVCFDSNSYLGLHRHPQVIEKVVAVTRRVGYGTASAQLLCGTNRYLCELEEALSEFHGRESTIVFPSGYAANTGTIAALVRRRDALICDQLSHASIHDGCRASAAQYNKQFAHNDLCDLGRLLHGAAGQDTKGKLVVTDGVFSMHGVLAPLPGLLDVCRAHGARLMVDDAHGVGVLGASGRGIEEHFGVRGEVDVLMGTLSKALGAVGGYVTGPREVINYLRFFAGSGMFTTALPAPICAGVTEALRLMIDEPVHRESLWANIRTFVPAVKDLGFIVSEPVSPIVTVFAGDQGFMYRLSQDLSAAGVKCGNVAYPAVPKGDSILRFTLNARHTPEDLAHAVEALERIGRKYGMLYRSREEIRAIGKSVITSTAA